MQLTKWAHACVEIGTGGASVVVDPGTFVPNRRELLAGADAVLVTHDHFDHVDAEVVAGALSARPGLRLWGPDSAITDLIAAGAPQQRLTPVRGDEVLDVAGVEVCCFGGAHAAIHDEIPVPRNVGFLVAGEVFHPGDSYRVPPFEVRTLLVPISGPWVKIGEAIDFVTSVRPRQTVAVHEVMSSEVGRSSAQRFLGEGGLTATPMRMLAAGESLEL